MLTGSTSTSATGETSTADAQGGRIVWKGIPRQCGPFPGPDADGCCANKYLPVLVCARARLLYNEIVGMTGSEHIPARPSCFDERVGRGIGIVNGALLGVGDRPTQRAAAAGGQASKSRRLLAFVTANSVLDVLLSRMALVDDDAVSKRVGN